MPSPPTTVTDSDHRGLTELLSARPDGWDGPSAGALQQTLDRARVVPSRDIPHYVITMGSRFLLRDPRLGGTTACTLVYPNEADGREGCISILSPAGVALLGRPEHDVVEWTVPTTHKRIQVGAVSYQPEAAEAFWTWAAPLMWKVQK